MSAKQPSFLPVRYLRQPEWLRHKRNQRSLQRQRMENMYLKPKAGKELPFGGNQRGFNPANDQVDASAQERLPLISR